MGGRAGSAAGAHTQGKVCKTVGGVSMDEWTPRASKVQGFECKREVRGHEGMPPDVLLGSVDQGALRGMSKKGSET
eukprot:1160105-Pelagomonas_calceolata.AAC.7